MEGHAKPDEAGADEDGARRRSYRFAAQWRRASLAVQATDLLSDLENLRQLGGGVRERAQVGPVEEPRELSALDN